MVRVPISREARRAARRTVQTAVVKLAARGSGRAGLFRRPSRANVTDVLSGWLADID